MCTLLKVANTRPVDLISPLLVHEEHITSVGSTSDNSMALACFSCAVRSFSASSAFFTCFPHFWPFGVRAAPHTRWSPSATCCGRSLRKMQIICPPLFLRPYVERHPHTSSQYLALAEFAANNAINVATGYSPFFLNSGDHPSVPSIFMHCGGCVEPS